MKEKLSRNLGLKILSIVLATLLWIVIANINDPYTTVTFKDVKVEILNEDAITSLEQVYDVVNNETVDFTVKARQTIIESLSVDDFSVTADLKHISDVNAVPIDISCPEYEDDIDIIRGRYPVMEISREQAKEQSFKVNIVEIGEVAEGYHLCEKTASPNMIKISGPKTRIDRIADVVVEVDVTGKTESFKTTGTPVLYDNNGDIIDASKLTFSSDLVSISLGIYKVKTINVYITTTGEPGKGYLLNGVDYQPKQITISGPEEELKNLHSLKVEMDITGETKTLEKEISLQDALPDNVTLVGDDISAVVTVTIEKLETKDLTVFPYEIQVKDGSTRMNDMLTVAGVLTKIIGSNEVVSKVTKQSLKPYIDVSSFSAGTYNVPIQFELPDGVELLNQPMVSIRINE